MKHKRKSVPLCRAKPFARGTRYTRGPCNARKPRLTVALHRWWRWAHETCDVVYDDGETMLFKVREWVL